MVTKCYVSGRPKDCRDCKSWRNKKVGCVLGKQNCRYLVSLVTEDTPIVNSSCISKAEVVTVGGI